MTDHRSQLSDARLEVLHELNKNNGEILGISKLAKRRNVKKSPQGRTLEAMESDGLVNLEELGNYVRISLTSVGREIIEDTPYGAGQCHSDVTESNDKSVINKNRLHGIFVEVEVKNSNQVPDRWWGKIQSYDGVDVLDGERENDYIIARDKWVFRCHKESVTMQLRQGCTFKSNSSAESFSEFTRSLKDAVNWLSNAVGEQFRVESMEVKRAECAFPEDHQALLADAVPGLDLQDIRVHDKDIGQDVIEFDKSKAVPEREALSGVRCEEVSRNLERENEQLALNTQAIKFRHGFESEASIQELNPVQAVKNIKQVESNQEQINKVEDRLEGLLELKAEERRKTEKMEELLEKLTQKVYEEEQQSSGGQSFEDPVQKIFMETWQDPEYSRPWFDHGHLKAWRTRESGKKECVTLLDKETVERLKN